MDAVYWKIELIVDNAMGVVSEFHASNREDTLVPVAITKSEIKDGQSLTYISGVIERFPTMKEIKEMIQKAYKDHEKETTEVKGVKYEKDANGNFTDGKSFSISK